MRSRAGWGLVLGFLAVNVWSAAPAREADTGVLRLWELPGVTLVAADGSNPRQVLQRLALTERALSKLLATPVKPTMIPTRIWLVPGKVWSRYLAPSLAISGEFVPRRFSNYLLLNADIGGTAMRSGLQHEYTHHFLRTQWGGLYPLWFDEGLAQLMGAARLHPRRAEFEVPRPVPLGAWVEMSRLFDLDKNSREYLSPATTDAVHGESWAIVHRALFSDTRFANQVFAYITAINRLVPSEDAVRLAFGMSFPELDADMRGYAQREVFAVGAVEFDAVPPVTLPPGRVLDRTEALERLARVMFDTGFQAERLGEVIDSAARSAPGSARVRLLQLRLAVRERRDAEALRLAASLDAEGGVEMLRDTGLALFERMQESPVRQHDAGRDAGPDEQRAVFERAAFDRLDRALRIDGGDVEAAWAYALLAVKLREGIATALDRLAAARSRMLGHPDLAEATALALEARGGEDAMQPYLLDALRNTSSPEQRARMARRLAQWRENERRKATQ